LNNAAAKGYAVSALDWQRFQGAMQNEFQIALRIGGRFALNNFGPAAPLPVRGAVGRSARSNACR
jgi:hypothetical protein